MATRRRTSATKTAKTASATIKKSTPRASVKKVTTTAPKRVNKVTPKEVIKVTEVTPTPATEPVIINLPEGTNLKKRPMNVETATKDTLNLEKLFKDYPRDGFALALLPLLLLEALTKEGLKLAGVIS